MPNIGLLPFNTARYSFMKIDHYKTLSLPNQGPVDLDNCIAIAKYHFEASFEDEANISKFLGAFEKPYPHEGGNGRNYIQVVAEDYLDKGLSVAAIFGHPEDKLTDSPRFIAALFMMLTKFYEHKYIKDLGLVVGAPLKLESYSGMPINDLLSTLCDIYWAPTKSENREVYRKKAGLTEEELDEVMEFMAIGLGLALLRDTKPRKNQSDNGKLVTVNPTGTRAKILIGADNKPQSIILPQAEANTARIISEARALWPVGVKGDEIRLGPIISTLPLPTAEFDKDTRVYLQLQELEDSLDVTCQLIDEIVGKKNVAKYDRQTPSGWLHSLYVSQ